jgi:hypothetical protein
MSRAYDAVIGFLGQRKRAYQLAFGNRPEANAMLRDLAKFCRAFDSTFLPDARAHAVLEGRREVWLRIQQHLNLSEDQLAVLYKAVQPKLE